MDVVFLARLRHALEIRGGWSDCEDRDGDTLHMSYVFDRAAVPFVVHIHVRLDEDTGEHIVWVTPRDDEDDEIAVQTRDLVGGDAIYAIMHRVFRDGRRGAEPDKWGPGVWRMLAQTQRCVLETPEAAAAFADFYARLGVPKELATKLCDAVVNKSPGEFSL
jgi:hypothetical protein